MKKTLAAAGLALALLAGQALAQTSTAPRVADRVGAPAGDSDQLAGGIPAGLIFAGVTVASFLVFSEATDDDSDSD